jgi:hypothetical protein
MPALPRDRLVHDLGPCAEPDAGTSDPVCSVARGPGAAGSGGLGIWPRHRLGDPRRSGGFRTRSAVHVLAAPAPR